MRTPTPPDEARGKTAHILAGCAGPDCSWETIDGALVHINRTPRRYIGQVHRLHAKKWRTVTGVCRTKEAALAKALQRIGSAEHARALWVGGRDAYYEPFVAMEAR